jgi:hypothetical protein
MRARFARLAKLSRKAARAMRWRLFHFPARVVRYSPLILWTSSTILRSALQ